MNSLVEENYLKALFHLSKNGGGEVNVKDLSKHLEIKMPTVNSMMKKLAEKDLVIYESYKPLRLSEKGILKASLIVRKHRLTEMFLVQEMGFGWEQVHEIAEQIEHIQSPLFFDKMDELLNYPKFDPHGSPIPDKNGKFDTTNYQKLAEFKKDDEVEICAVTGSSDEFLKYLNSKNIQLNDKIVILDLEEFDGTMTVKFLKNDKIETFSNHVTQRLLGK
ncbi:iron (metal) dependent repressor, DtxR family [Chishuiella changwenlii]|jgi:DtxR family Mn-dependent transcriptional regulator|uniref:Transcriptional regulator MntR n=1 Tax=Chishuiella changwenlii TaxID=1434701 RepID=A0A1M6YF66_9FLAO|nr:metal-dependent transcriptional regulator [Chishuiella changwenlii]GGE97412.1 iron-dependent repressor [Chishuiella changwenlii]SHL16961.1 iron (metal) dependent repressor, DtxR family [Chishuiella changwenlii]